MDLHSPFWISGRASSNFRLTWLADKPVLSGIVSVSRALTCYTLFPLNVPPPGGGTYCQFQVTLPLATSTVPLKVADPADPEAARDMEPFAFTDPVTPNVNW